MKKKPNRFARMVGKVQRTDDWGIDCVSSDEVVTLLRTEHHAVVRLVKRTAQAFGDMGLARAMKDDLLAALNRRAK